MAAKVPLKQSIHYNSAHNEHTCHNSLSSKIRLKYKTISKKFVIKKYKTPSHAPKKNSGTDQRYTTLYVAKNESNLVMYILARLKWKPVAYSMHKRLFKIYTITSQLNFPTMKDNLNKEPKRKKSKVSSTGFRGIARVE